MDELKNARMVSEGPLENVPIETQEPPVVSQAWF